MGGSRTLEPKISSVTLQNPRKKTVTHPSSHKTPVVYREKIAHATVSQQKDIMKRKESGKCVTAFLQGKNFTALHKELGNKKLIKTEKKKKALNPP